MGPNLDNRARNRVQPPLVLHPTANGTNRKDISFILGAVATTFVFYIATGRDYVDLRIARNRVIRWIGLSGAGL